MTETPADENTMPEAAPEQASDEEHVDLTETVAPVYCRWCGVPHDMVLNEGDDWLCPHCDRYQDAMVCPTCHQLARVSHLPAEVVPEVHAPARRKKG